MQRGVVPPSQHCPGRSMGGRRLGVPDMRRRPVGLVAGVCVVAACVVASACGTQGTTGAGSRSTATVPTTGTGGQPGARTGTGSGERRARGRDARVLREWPTFGLTSARPNATRRPTGITERNARRLRRQQVRLPGTVDSSPILVAGRIVVTTTYGRTLAVDPRNGRILWRFTPPGIASWAGSARITNMSPTTDPSRRFVYAASPDGRVHKLSLTDGSEQPGWPVAVTRDPSHEKLTSSLAVSRGRLIVATGGYLGDAPPYQGHVVSIDTASGRIAAVFNTLCSDRHAIFDPRSCPASHSAIWSRSGATTEPGSGRLLVATGNGPFDGRTNWGNSVLELSPDGSRLLHSWTPRNAEQLSATDADVGSTSPALLPGGLVLQSGKDAVLHLLDLRRLNGTTGAASPRRGGQLQDVPAPGGQPVFTAPAVQGDIVYVASAGGTAAYRVIRRRLAPLWRVPAAGTTPVVAGGLLYVYDPDGGGVRVRRPDSGKLVATLPAGRGHWNSPIVAGGVVVAPEGDANDHATSGRLNLYRVR